jgi:hypothetical protein
MISLCVAHGPIDIVWLFGLKESSLLKFEIRYRHPNKRANNEENFTKDIENNQTIAK